MWEGGWIGDSRSTADAEYVQLGLVQTHIAQCEARKDARQDNEDGDEACKDNEFNIVWFGGAAAGQEVVR